MLVFGGVNQVIQRGGGGCAWILWRVPAVEPKNPQVCHGQKRWNEKDLALRRKATGFFCWLQLESWFGCIQKQDAFDLKDNSWKCGKQQVIFEVRKVYPETPQGLSSKCSCVHRGIAYAHRFQFHPNEQMRFHDTWHQRQVHDQNECQSGLHLACSTLRLQVRKVIF